MKQHIDKLNRLSESHGALQPGKGMASGVIALMLAALCFLGVLAFHFPEYLTTPRAEEVVQRRRHARCCCSGRWCCRARSRSSTSS